MIERKYTFSLVWCFLGLAVSTQGMNLLLRPYDTLIRPEIYEDRCLELTFWAEGGIHNARAFAENGSSVNVLSYLSQNQDALAMLDGFPLTSPITQFRLALDAVDDGVRGHLLFNGNLHLDFGGAVGGRWYFLPHAWITAYIPFYKERLTDVVITDLTQMLTAADVRVRNQLTGNLAAVITEFGDGLQIGPWKRSGLGDLNLMVEWFYNFPQARPLLKNVELDGRVGFTFPTGLKADENLLIALPFGYDGATGIVYGGGLNVLLGYNFKAGFDVQLLQLFGNTRDRRIKTAIDQTDLLLLAKTRAYKDYGLIQRFNLFVQAYHVVGGASLLVGYQFLKKGEDRLALDSCAYSTSIANTAASLDEWILHSAECNLHYDFNVHMCEDTVIEPQISLYARIPFNGKRAIAFTTVGVIFSIDF